MPEVVGWRAVEGPESYTGIINEFLTALDDEIAVIKETGGDQKYVLKHGEFIVDIAEYNIYRFPIDIDVRLDEDSPVDIIIGDDKIDGYIVSSNEEYIDVAIKGDLGAHITQVIIISNISKILETLKARYKEILSSLKVYNKNGCMTLFGFSEPKCITSTEHCLVEDLNHEQRSAVDKSIQQDVTFIWGPPGTGKTRTLSVILNGLIINGKSVLLTSHTNLAVDEALKKFAEDPQNKQIIEDGRVIRYGTIANPDPVLKNFLIDSIIIRKSKPLQDKADEIKGILRILEEKIGVLNSMIGSPEYGIIVSCREEIQKNTQNRGVLIQELSSIRDKIIDCNRETARLQSIVDRSSNSFFNYIGYLFSDATPKKFLELKQSLAKLTENEAALTNNISRIETRTEEVHKKIIETKENILVSTKLDTIEDIDNADKKIYDFNEQIEGHKKDLNQIRTQLSGIKEQIFKDALVIGCTLTKSYMDQKIFDRRFDVMILDEASMANLPSIFFVSGLSSRHIISGDFRQLAPIAKSNSEIAEKWLRRDIFLQSGVIKSIEEDFEDNRLIMLKEQYRMHPDIASLINHRMYKGLLKTSIKTQNEKSKITCLPPFENTARVLCDTSMINPWCSRTQSNSRINLYSAMLAVQIAENALRGGVKDIGIVTPYRAQAKIIESLLDEKKISKKVAYASTIHKFQGNQKENIIIDLVEGGIQNDNVGRLLREYSIGSDTSRLMNVAVSRAQGKVIVIANYQFFKHHLKNGNLVFDIITQIKDKGLVVDSSEILSSYYGLTNTKVAGGKASIMEDEKLTQYNEISFYKAFVNDIKNASFRIIIFSPFITKNRMRKLFNYLKEAADRGVNVYLIVRAPRTDSNNYEEINGLIDEIRKASIHVVTSSQKLGLNEEFHEKFALIDRRILYYGSLNILSQSNTTESMLAFTNKETIDTIIKNIDVDNIIRKYNVTSKRDKKILKPLEADDFSKEIANAQYNAGVLQIKKNNYQEAINYFRSAIKINPEAADYYYYLGVAFCKNDQKTQAIPQFRKALELSPYNLKYQQVIQMIEDKEPVGN